MEKALIIIIVFLLTMPVKAQDTIRLTSAGTLSATLVSAQVNPDTLSTLIVNGLINACDIKFMRDSMASLATINLKNSRITAYTGSDGTGPSPGSYRADEMPEYSFYNLEKESGKTSLTSLELPDSILFIGNNALQDCSRLSGILTIPGSVVSIGDHAFFGCSGFTGDLLIPNSVMTIGKGAFEFCFGFTGYLTISNSITSIPECAFDSCVGLTGSLVIPNSVKSIGDFSFTGCHGFTGDLVIPNSVDTIHNAAFSGCSGLSRVVFIPDSFKYFGAAVFRGCSGINSFVVDDDNALFAVIDGVLYNKAKTKLISYPAARAAHSFVIPSSIDTIGCEAFYWCKNLTGDLVIPNSVKMIYNGAFSGCSGFTGNLTIPASVTYIGDDAFANCSGFNGNLNIGNKVTVLGTGAFLNCSGLTGNLIIPDSLTIIYNQVFAGCSGFSGDLIIPNSIRYFGYQVFYGCSGFDGILNIPNSLDTLGHGAFEGCSGLRQIIITDTTPPIIDESTFNNVNKSLCQLVVPSGSIPVYKNAAYWNEFKNITNLSTVNSPQISINNMNETGFLRLFQNHSVKSVNIEAEKIRSIVVYNLLGIVILRYNSIGRECVNLNIANLKSGNYLVKGTFFNGAVNFLRMTVF